MFLVGMVSFFVGAILSAFILYVYFLKKETAAKEELSKLRAKIDLSESLQDIIKRDFVQLAQETIKNEQEDLR